MLASLWFAVALAAPLDDVREAVGGDAWINWTTLEVEVRGAALPSGVDSSRKVVETTARRPLGGKIERAAEEVRVQGTLTVADLSEDPEDGAVLAKRIARWAESEARYYASGRVEIVAALSITDVLKPWSLHQTKPSPTKEEGAYTGWVIDARGTGALPVFAPEVVAPDGESLYEGMVWSDAPPETTAVIYVWDAAHPAAARAGEHPMFSRVTSVQGGEWTLDEASAAAVRASIQNARLLGMGRVVVVIDP